MMKRNSVLNSVKDLSWMAVSYKILYRNSLKKESLYLASFGEQKQLKVLIHIYMTPNKESFSKQDFIITRATVYLHVFYALSEIAMILAILLSRKKNLMTYMFPTPHFYTYFSQFNWLKEKFCTSVKFRAPFRRIYFPSVISKEWHFGNVCYILMTQNLNYKNEFLSLWIITKTCLYKFDPLKLHFYKVKLGFTWVNVILSYFC